MNSQIQESNVNTENKKQHIFATIKKFLKDMQQKLYKAPWLYLVFCFFAPVAIMYLIYCLKGTYPFGTASPLVLDLNSQYVSFFEALREAVNGNASLLYSFSRSLGGEFLGIYAYYMASPLTYIVALFPADRIQEAILFIMILKTGLSGLTMGYYLHKRTKNRNRLVVFIFSLMYSLSAYAVVQQNNTMWIDALILLPLLTYGLENLITHRKYKLYVITLATILISNYYIGYMICIFCVLYFFYYYFSKHANEINPNGEKNHFVRTGLRFSAFSGLAGGIAGFMLIAAYYSLGFGKTEFSTPNWALESKFDILDFLTKLLPGAYDTVEPAGLPFIYCGLLIIFLLPVYFMAKKISTREKIASLALVSVFLISFIVSPIDLIWHGFSTPNWLNARYSFIFCFVVLVISYKGFGNLRQLSEKFILGIGGLLLLLTVMAEKFEFSSYIASDKKLPVFACIWFTVFFTVILIVLLCLRIKKKKPHITQTVSSVLAAVICLELLCNGVVCLYYFNKDVYYAQYDDYQERIVDLRPIIEDTKEYDSGFFRMEKVDHRTKNDNMALGLKGITSSTSTLNAKAIQFVNYMGYTGRAHLTMYKGGTAFSDSLLNITYVLDKESSTRYNEVYSELEGISDKKHKVMENPFVMSLAYGVDKKTNNVTFESSTYYFERYNNLITNMLGETKSVQLFKPLYGLKMEGTNCELDSISGECKTTKDKKGTVYFRYTANYTGNYYFYSPVNKKADFSRIRFYEKALSEIAKTPTDASGVSSNYNKTLKSSYTNYLGTDTNHVLYAGYFTKGSVIEIEIEVPTSKTFKFDKSENFLWYFNEEAYENSMERLLAGPQLKIDDNSTDDHITGSMTTTATSQMILTTIPYDAGWNVYVDGQKTEIYETLDALMAFDIANAGDHTIEFRYMPSCYYIGFAISIISILIFIALCVIEFVLKKKKIFALPAVSEEYWILDDFDEDANIEKFDKNEQIASDDEEMEESKAPDDTPAENDENLSAENAQTEESDTETQVTGEEN